MVRIFSNFYQSFTKFLPNFFSENLVKIKGFSNFYYKNLVTFTNFCEKILVKIGKTKLVRISKKIYQFLINFSNSYQIEFLVKSY